MYTVRIENAYSDGHLSTAEVTLAGPVEGEGLDNWFETEVWPHTGDGHGQDETLGCFYTATVLAADIEEHVGKEHEWG